MSTAFRISLDGAQQVPSVVSTASGLGTAVFDSTTSSMSITINIQGLDWGPLLGQASQTMTTADDVNGVHIHNAARGANGGIVLDWPSGGDADDFAVSGVLADGSRTLTSNWETTDVNPITAFVATLAGATLASDVPLYVNIHTVAFPGGEIRGQLVTIATDNGEAVTGTAGNDILPGLDGDDTISGLAGNDTLDGGTGTDTLMGGLGNDTYVVDNAGDVVTENAGEGTDTVLSTAHLALSANVENLTLVGGADLQGYGNSDANTITGNAGSNLLDGRGGADVMLGGAGDDVYFVDNAGDQVIENAGEGNDAVFSTAHLVLQGSADLQGYGNAGTNKIYGNAGSNLLDGRAGADVMRGGAGDDVYFIDTPGDVVVENLNEGADAIFSTANIQTMLAANVETLVLLGADNLFGIGNALANDIYGNSGDNSLDGAGGADFLVGDAGNDTFVFHAGEADGDTVFDFAGNGGAAGDLLQFVGFGTTFAGATFTQIGATNQWQIHSGLDAHNEIITFSNGASVDPSDYAFI